MKLRAAIAGTLGAMQPMTGCSTGNCNLPEFDFDVTATFTHEELDAIFRTDVSDDSRDACEWACYRALERERPVGSIRKLSECELVLDPGFGMVSTSTAETGDTGEDPAVMGSVDCSGVAVEGFCLGRRPMHVHPASMSRGKLAALADLERMSITAFLELATQLRGMGAPDRHIRRCISAAHDERVHTALMIALGGGGARLPAVPTVSPLPASPFEIAVHNATEGCVYECWAALTAHWQSRHAATPILRRVFRCIARDETRHGQLAWDLHDWFLATLPARKRTHVLAAQRHALTTLSTVATTGERMPQALGFPSDAVAARLASRFARRLSTDAHARRWAPS